jgi:hypothetical protein
VLENTYGTCYYASTATVSSKNCDDLTRSGDKKPRWRLVLAVEEMLCDQDLKANLHNQAIALIEGF